METDKEEVSSVEGPWEEWLLGNFDRCLTYSKKPTVTGNKLAENSHNV